MDRIFKVRKDKLDLRDHLAMRSAATLSYAVNLSANLGPVRDQGQVGSCTGQAGSGWMDWLFATFRQYFLHAPTGAIEFSALFLYAQERLKNHTFPDDSGSDSRTLMQVLNQIGICLNAVDPYVDTAIANQPSADMIAAAGLFKIGAYHRVLFDDGLATAKSVLASGYCRVIGIPVYQSIQSDEVAETGLLPIPSSTETPVGGHEMLVWGYDDSVKIGTAQGAEQVRNSWGADWGIKGNLRIPYDYYAAVGGNDTCDSWVGHMGKPWVPKP